MIFFFVFYGHVDLVLDGVDVKKVEPLTSCHGLNQLVDAGQWIVIFWKDFIEVSEVDAHHPLPFFLLHQNQVLPTIQGEGPQMSPALVSFSTSCLMASLLPQDNFHRFCFTRNRPVFMARKFSMTSRGTPIMLEGDQAKRYMFSLKRMRWSFCWSRAKLDPIKNLQTQTTKHL